MDSRPLCPTRAGAFSCSLLRGHVGACLTAEGRGVLGSSLAAPELESARAAPGIVPERWEVCDDAASHEPAEGSDSTYAPSCLTGFATLYGARFFLSAIRVSEAESADGIQHAWDEDDESALGSWAAADETGDGHYTTVEIPGFVGRWVVFGSLGGA